MKKEEDFQPVLQTPRGSSSNPAQPKDDEESRPSRFQRQDPTHWCQHGLRNRKHVPLTVRKTCFRIGMYTKVVLQHMS